LESASHGGSNKEAFHGRENHRDLEGGRGRDEGGRGVQEARNLGCDVLQPKLQVWWHVGVRGPAVEDPGEEEKFLLSVSGSGVIKVNCVNLNEAPIADVVWWDWLIKLEAKRRFIELALKRPLSGLNFMQALLVADKEREIVGRPLRSGEVFAQMFNSD